jgi:hypothetical protein
MQHAGAVECLERCVFCKKTGTAQNLNMCTVCGSFFCHKCSGTCLCLSAEHGRVKKVEGKSARKTQAIAAVTAGVLLSIASCGVHALYQHFGVRSSATLTDDAALGAIGSVIGYGLQRLELDSLIRLVGQLF